MLLLGALLVLPAISGVSGYSQSQCRLVGDCKSRLVNLNLADTMQECRQYGRKLKKDAELAAQPNFDRYGRRLPRTQTTSRAPAPGEYVSWNSNNKLCLAYEGCESINGIDATATHTFSSHVDCECHQPVFCNGLVVGNSIVEDEVSCDQACQAEESCSWFTYFEDHKACILMKDCPSPKTSCTNCYSSLKSCGLSLTTQQLSTNQLPSTQQLTVKNEYNRLFVVDDRMVAKIINLNDASDECKLSSPFPLQSVSVISYLEDKGAILACGTKNSNRGYSTDQCLSYDGSWSTVPSTIQNHCPHHTTSSASPDQSLWIIGARQSSMNNRNGNCLNEFSSELFFGYGWKEGPAHPYATTSDEQLTEHNRPCLVQLNSTHSMYIGGAPNLEETYIYDWGREVWIKSASLNHPRGSHSCVVVEGEGVLVAGGRNGNTTFVRSLELFDISEEKWIVQPSLPDNTVPRSLYLLHHGNNVIAIYDEKVYKRGEDATWTLIDGLHVPVKANRGGLRHVLVPDTMVNQCI